MSSTCYFVDTESVHNRWGHLLKMITPKDTVLAFFHNNCTPMTAGFINALLKSGAHVELISRIQKSHSSAAINFQLVTELGYRIASKPDMTYVLVSENTEYDPLIEYWTNKDANLSRFNIMTSKPEEISMSYNHRPNDEFKDKTKPTPPVTEPTQDNQQNLVTLTATAKDPEEPFNTPIIKKTVEPATAKEQKLSEKPATAEPSPKIQYLSKKACIQDYYVRLNKLHIPAVRSKAIAELMVDIMEKPVNQRMLGLYNAMSTQFGKKSAFTKTYYMPVKMLVAEINRTGPLPETLLETQTSDTAE